MRTGNINEKRNRRMRIKALILVAMLLMSGCDEDNFPPELCNEPSDVEVFIAENNVVGLCFSDPEGDKLTVTATSLDPGIAEAVIQGSTRAVSITGLSVGETMVMVTATDTKGQSIGHDIDVVVPNRSPEVTNDLPDVDLTNESPEVTLDLSAYFEDPDDHDLAFEVDISDETIISATLQGASLTLSRVGDRGSAILTVIAHDDYGGSAENGSNVQLRVIIEVVNEQFDEIRSEWLTNDFTSTSIVENRLRIAATDSTRLGALGIEVSEPVTNWTISANVEGTAGMVPSMIVEGTDSTEAFMVMFGADARDLLPNRDLPKSSLIVLWWEANSETWLINEDWLSLHPEIPDPGTAMDIELQRGANALQVLVNETEVLKIPTSQLNLITENTALIYLTAFPLDIVENEAVFFDWLIASGVPDNGSATVISKQLVLPDWRKVKVVR